ncbi:MAG: hypothetical protein ACRD2K_00405 [Terriglobales bacterium]
MRLRTSAITTALLAALALLTWAQGAPAKGVLGAAELKQLVPHDFFFAGKTASVQLRNSAGVRFANGKLLLAALVDTAGYSSAIEEKYQGLLIAETTLHIEGASLKPGAYGFGFSKGKFLVMDVAADDVLSVAAQADDKVKPVMPLKIVEQAGGFRLYAGKSFVAVKAQ